MRKTGVVKSWTVKKGYGFVLCEGQDYFAHYSYIKFGGDGKRNLSVGQEVEFIPVSDEKGLKATDITLPDSEERQQALKWWGVA